MEIDNDVDDTGGEFVMYLDKEKQHYDDVMEALEEIYRAFLVSDESTTVKELKNKNTVDIEKALDTYIYYRNIRQKYK